MNTVTTKKRARSSLEESSGDREPLHSAKRQRAPEGSVEAYTENEPSEPRTVSSTGSESTRSCSTPPSSIEARSPPPFTQTFRDKRPVTQEDREAINKAIFHTYMDLNERTNGIVRMNGKVVPKEGYGEVWDISIESFGYQYALLQARYQDWQIQKDSKDGKKVLSKKYKRVKQFDTLKEVEGPWISGFDDWSEPKVAEFIDLCD